MIQDAARRRRPPVFRFQIFRFSAFLLSPMSPEIYEKLGQFYLGRQVETDGKPTDDLVLYDSSSLTTHGVCVGMTVSG
jgi:hypothetical protein